jgi:ethanolamine ammonia-lyase small subunit
MSERDLERLVRELVTRALEAGPEATCPAGDAPLRAKVEAWLGRALAPRALSGDAFRPEGDRDLYLRATPARLGVGRTGSRLRTGTLLGFWRDHAAARDAVGSRVNPDIIARLGLVPLRSAARDRREFLLRPDLGRALAPESAARVESEGRRGARVQVVAADGLSAEALNANLPVLLPALLEGLAGEGAGGPVFFVENGRLAAGDEVARRLDAELLVTLVGERPGLKTASSLGAYVTYFRGRQISEAQRNMISNIHRDGLPPEEAARQLVGLCLKALGERRTGVEA